jgi:hypothetical protein
MKGRWAWVVGGVACIAVGVMVAGGIEHPVGAERSVAAIVSEWAPSVAEVACNYLNRDGTMLQKTGSATFVRDGTRAHVLTSLGDADLTSLAPPTGHLTNSEFIV